jgi:hypothetical protein
MAQHNRKDLRDGRIPIRASENGDFVIDVDQLFGVSNGMLTANELIDVVDSRGKIHSNPRTYPVFDAKNGQSIGRMNINAFLRKMM